MLDEHWYTAEYFEKRFSEEDPWNLATSSYEQEKYKRQLRVIQEQGPDPTAILEIGCAEGVHSEMLLDSFPNARLVGMDISSQAIERARNRIISDRGEFVVADISDFISQTTLSFDVIVWSETIYYNGAQLSVPELQTLIETVSDHLEQNGLLCSANVVEHGKEPISQFTKLPVIKTYQMMLAEELRQIHDAEYTEMKDDQPLTYRIWGFRNM